MATTQAHAGSNAQQDGIKSVLAKIATAPKTGTVPVVSSVPKDELSVPVAAPIPAAPAAVRNGQAASIRKGWKGLGDLFASVTDEASAASALAVVQVSKDDAIWAENVTAYALQCKGFAHKRFAQLKGISEQSVSNRAWMGRMVIDFPAISRDDANLIRKGFSKGTARKAICEMIESGTLTVPAALAAIESASKRGPQRTAAEKAADKAAADKAEADKAEAVGPQQARDVHGVAAVLMAAATELIRFDLTTLTRDERSAVLARLLDVTAECEMADIAADLAETVTA